MTTVFHILDPEDWAAAARLGEYRAPSLDVEGFIHCSFEGQVAATANLHYGDSAELCVVELDPARIAAPVRVEDISARGEAFPHVYGPIPTVAAVAVHPLVRDESGAWVYEPLE
jgi:uncharacterized protein (DUF952 family)